MKAVAESFLYAIFPFVVFALSVAMPLKDEVFKPILAILAVLFFVSLFLIPEKLKEIVRDKTFLFVSGFFALTFLFGVVLCGDFYNNQKYFFYFYISYLLLFVIGRFFLSRLWARRVVYAGMITSGLIASFQGLISVRSWNNFRFVKGNMGQHNQLGMFVGAILSGSFVEAFLGKGDENWAFWPISIVFLITLLGTFSRGAWVAFAVVVLISVLKALFSNDAGLGRKIGILLFLLMVIISAGISYKHSPFFKNRVKALEQFKLSGRENIWKEAISKVRKKPFGCGIRVVQEGFNPHNQVLGVAVSSGIVTAAYFIVMCLALLFSFRENLFSFPGMAVVFLLVHNLVECSFLVIWSNSCLFWLMLGMFTSEGENAKH